MENKPILELIKQDIKTHPVVLYMKGTKEFPMCGFSARVVEILKELEVSFETRNVLENDDLRAAIKEYSNWPTLPQLYSNGEFIGGCDITEQLYQTGELKNVLQTVTA